MEHNLFEEFQERKIKLKSLALKAKDYNWIDETRYNELIDKIDNDILTIGVIGQMKCGKSTFLNSFVFEDTILPAATTPMTAALSVITYGEEKKVVAEFYTNEEWEEFYAGEEGSSTFYIDMVERKFAKNSTASFDKRYDLLDSVDEMFHVIKDENKK